MEKLLITNGLRYVFFSFPLLSLPVFFHCARHSFATIARNDCGVGMDDIALCLTHASFYRVTDTYVKPDFSRVDRVIEKVVDYVFHEKEIGR